MESRFAQRSCSPPFTLHSPLIFVILAALLSAAPVGAQPADDWIIETVAGSTGIGDGGLATAARIFFLQTWLFDSVVAQNTPDRPHYLGAALDSAGNIYIADSLDNRIRKVDAATGNISTVAGDGTRGFGGDGGPATAAQLNGPNSVALDGAGNLYIAENHSHRIRRVDAATGYISTVAGNGAPRFGGDGGLATAAQLHFPSGVALDGAGNLYIADSGNYRIRKVDAATGNISTVAGDGTSGDDGDGGLAVDARLAQPEGIALDGAGNLYIADSDNHRIRKVDADGYISTVAGDGTSGDDGDGGSAIEAQLNRPIGVALDGSGNLYIADYLNNRIRKVDAATGYISTVAGDGAGSFGGDGGLATAAQLRLPHDVALDGAGNLYIADSDNHRIRKVDSATDNISTVAGGRTGDGGLATAASLDFPKDMAVDGSGNLYIADTENNRIRKVDAVMGNISTVAGDGTNGDGGDSGDGDLATAAQLSRPAGVALDGSGNLYIADYDNDRIRRVDAATGYISTVAGGGTGGDGGPATAAQLNGPNSVALDGAGNLYIADAHNNRIRKVDAATGYISTVAGDGTSGDDGDGGLAIEAQLAQPEGIALDGAGNLYIADSDNHRIRKVDADGYISTVAGTGGSGYSGDGGLAVDARLYFPSSVALDGSGNLYIADSGNSRIRKVDADGYISTVAGTGGHGYSGDGIWPSEAQLFSPAGVALDGSGNLYIADSGNHRIRKVRPPPPVTLGAVPATITSGRSAKLVWSSANAVSAEIDNGIGSVGLSDSRSVSPTMTTTYTLTVTDSNNVTAADTATVTVTPAPAATLVADPPTITSGQSSTLQGTSANAVSAVIRSGDLEIAGVALDPSVVSTVLVPVSPTATTEYILTVIDANSEHDATSVTITVTAPPTAVLTATDATITSGQSTTLEWTSTNAVSARIDNGVGTVSPPSAGSTTVSPTSTTTYTLTVTDANGAQAAASVTVTVTAPPTAVLTATDATITSGQSTTLEWASTNAVSARIDNGVGTVSPAAGGSTSVSPMSTTTYTLTVTDSNGAQAAASVTITVTAPPTAVLTATDATITNGQSTTLEWTSSNAVSARIDNGVGTVSPPSAGSTTVSPTSTTTYTLTVTDSNGAQAAASVTITVTAPPTAVLTATDATITSGQSTTLEWTSTNAVSARIDNGVGTVTPAAAGSTSVSPTATTTYTLTVTDANGAQAAATTTVTVTAPPTAALSANPTEIAGGESSTLTWTASNAVSARIDNGVGAVSPAAGGSTSVSPTATTTYTLTVTDANGAVAQAGATVTVTDSGPPPTAALSANPTQITSGQSTTLTWTASNAVSAEIDNGVGAVSPAAGGSTSVSPTATTTYTLTVSAADGRTAQASVTITVTAPPAAVLSADPPTITSGQSSTLRVASSNTVSAVIQPGNLTVSLDPSGAGSVSVSPETTTEYTLTVTDANNAVAIATATITVTAPPTAALSANPAEIAGGESTTLTWTASNAVSARIDNGVGAVSPAAGGSTSVSPTATTTYTLTVTDANGAVAQAGATVTVTDSGPPPTAALSASPTQITSGQSSTLTWTASNAVSARIDNGVGAVSPAAGGSTSVSPTATTTYTLTVSAADGRTAQASVTVTVDDGDPPPAVTLSANPAAIAEGESSTLIWTSTHATSAAIDQGIGPVALSGARQVSPTRTTAYTITVRNSDGMTAAATVSVTVTGPPEEPQLPVVRARTIELSFVLPQDAAPAAQPVVLYAENGAADFRAQPGPNWLAAEPASGSLAEDEETTIAVTVDPAGLPVERRRGLLYIRSGGRITDRVRVVLEVLPPLGPAVHEAVNAAAMSASGEPGLFGPTLLPLAPGSMVALRGENLLDRSFAEDEFIVSGSFPLPANLDGVRVSFDGVAARLFAAGPQRIYAQLPSALVSEALAQGLATATVTVETAAGESYPRRFPIGAHGPGIFTLSGQGTGQAAVVLAGTTVLAAAPGFDGEIQLEQPGEMVDIYTTSRPARAGEIVEIYATGLGAVEPPIADGANSCEPESVCAADFSNVVLRHTVERPQVWIGGVEVADEDILFSGLAPTLAAMNMVVARVPEGIEPSNAAEAIISIGGRTSQPGVTIAVE